MRVILLFISFLILAASCKTKNTKNEDTTVINVAEVENLKTETRFLSEFSNEFEYIRPEAKEGSYFTLMGVSFIGSEFVILFEKKTSQLYAFQRDGRFLGKLGNVGKAPNEYVTLPEVFVFPHIKEIHVSDFKRNKILRFDFNLTFKGNLKLDVVPSAIQTYKDKFYICAYNGEDLQKNGGKILVTRDPGSFSEQNVWYKIDDDSFSASIEMSGLQTNWFFYNNDTLYFALQSAKGVSIYNVLDNDINRRYELKFDANYNDKRSGIPEIFINKLMFFYNYLVIAYQQNYKTYSAYYNTETRKLSRFKIINDLDKGIDFYPMGRCDDKGYYSDDLQIGYFNDFWKTNESSRTYKKLTSKFPDREKWLRQTVALSEDDNPWIMVIK